VAFDQVEADGAGGSDVAELYDAGLQTGLTVPSGAAILAWLDQFDEIRQIDSDTSDESTIEAVDELFTAYWS
jgi:hypothetical protein